MLQIREMFSGSYSLVSAYHATLTLLCAVFTLLFLTEKKRLKIFKNKIHIKMVLCTEIYICLSTWHGNMLISEEKNTAVILRVNYNENKPIAILYS